MSTIGLKKTNHSLKPNYPILELDELYWFVGKKANSETRENTYVITMVMLPKRKTTVPTGYIDVAYYGEHIRNVHNKNDTFTVESVNADLRHYIPVLARRSRCFARKIETLFAVVDVFVAAYNRFGITKMMFRRNRNSISREYLFLCLISCNQRYCPRPVSIKS